MDVKMLVFFENLKCELQMACLDVKKLKYDVLKDSTYNFTYENKQIGRIKFGKRSSKMQIITLTTVTWLENLTLEEYISNISKWVKYIKQLL